MPGTVRSHRVLCASPERVYRAFLDPEAMVKWLPPHGFTGKVYRMSFTNFSSGHSHSFGGSYLELVPHERIRHTDKFDDPNLPGEMQVTITLKKVSCGPSFPSCKKGSPTSFPPRPAPSAGKNRSPSLRSSSRRRFRGKETQN